jgi:hypothetical protein
MSSTWLKDLVHIIVEPSMRDAKVHKDGFTYGVKATADLRGLHAAIVARLADAIDANYIPYGTVNGWIAHEHAHALVTTSYDRDVCDRIIQAGINPIQAGINPIQAGINPIKRAGKDNFLLLLTSRFWWKNSLLPDEPALGVLQLVRDCHRLAAQQPSAGILNSPTTTTAAPVRRSDASLTRAISGRHTQPIGLILPSDRD